MSDPGPDTSRERHLFSADRPISSRQEDLLGRASFAQSLANAIKQWKGKDSLVIALYGPWGSGKSSVKNMVLESLRQSSDDCPLILEFNPWQWASQDQLAQAFFEEMGNVVGQPEQGESGKRQAAKLKSYGTYLTLGANLTTSLKTVLPLLGIPGSGILELLSPGLKQSADVLKEGAQGLSAQAEVASKNLFTLKKELAEELRQLPRLILVVMDDVDRLTRDEIKLLFQLVKANADFPNLIYLMLFQRDVVEKSLEEIGPINGKEFLEKIVQVGFDVPAIERPRLEKVLFAGLEALLADEKVGSRFDQQRWGNLFFAGLRDYFENLRDVHRFLATLQFHVGLFRGGSFEVNPVDLIALEVIRTFESPVYELLSQNKPVFTDLSDRDLLGDRTRERKRLVEGIMAKASDAHRSRVQEILKQLFPTVEWVFGGIHYGSSSADKWFRDLRVCHEDVFDRYFHFATPLGDISQTEIDEVLSVVGDRKVLAEKLRALNDRSLLGVLLDRLEDFKETIDLQHSVPFITALYDIGDEIPDEPKGFFSMASDMHACRIIYWYLKREKDARRPVQIIKEAMRATSGLYLPVMHTSLESSDRDKKAAAEGNMVGDDDLKELQQICVRKIRQAAQDGRLKSHSKLSYLLYCWRHWSSPEESSKWATDIIQTDEGLLSFLTSLLQKRTGFGMGDYVGHESWSVSLKTIEDFVALNAVAERVDRLPLETISEKHRRAIDAFNRALKRRQDGKGDDSFYDDE